MYPQFTNRETDAYGVKVTWLSLQRASLTLGLCFKPLDHYSFFSARKVSIVDLQCYLKSLLG